MRPPPQLLGDGALSGGFGQDGIRAVRVGEIDLEGWRAGWSAPDASGWRRYRPVVRRGPLEEHLGGGHGVEPRVRSVENATRSSRSASVKGLKKVRRRLSLRVRQNLSMRAMEPL